MKEGRLTKYGREEDQIKVTPGLSVVVARSDQEAQDRFWELQSKIEFKNLEFGGFDLSGYDLDGPLPDLPYQPGENGQGRFLQQLELTRRENLTIRQLVLKFRVARGHVQAIGSVKTVADLIEQWFVEKGTDGFNVVPPSCRAASPTSSTSSCPSCSGAASSARNTRGAHCASTWGCGGRPIRTRRLPSAPRLASLAKAA